jgi:hypothetical protein
MVPPIQQFPFLHRVRSAHSHLQRPLTSFTQAAMNDIELTSATARDPRIAPESAAPSDNRRDVSPCIVYALAVTNSSLAIGPASSNPQG